MAQVNVEAMGEPMSSEATEIRAAERSRGGMAYEVILSQPAMETPPRPRPSSPPKQPIAIEDIETKLKAAEERRQSVGVQRKSQLEAKWSHIEEVNQKRQEFNNNFMQQAREQLEKRLELTNENREQILTQLRSKLKEHDDKVNDVRKSIEQQKEEMKENFEKKMSTVLENRDDMINKLVQKLKEHEDRVAEVRKQQEEKIAQLGEKIEKKLGLAQENRDQQLAKKLETLKEHEKHVEMVRQKSSAGSDGSGSNSPTDETISATSG